MEGKMIDTLVGLLVIAGVLVAVSVAVGAMFGGVVWGFCLFVSFC